MTTEDEFIRFIGKLVFAPEQCGWSQLPPERQNLFCAYAAQTGLESLFLLTIGEALPERYLDEFSKVYHREAMIRLIEKAQLLAFNRQWDEKRVPHIALKGADLAFRVYPDPALRPHGDWDILFRKEDCPAVLRALMYQGWVTFSGRSLAEIASEKHHYERMRNDKSTLEIHWTLPHFGTATQEEIWAETTQDAQGSRHLTPEMNLLLLCAHASQDSFCHTSKWHILLDAGYILRHDIVDWQKVRALADRWGIIQPALLLNLWPDFFPEKLIPLGNIDLEAQEALRAVFQMWGQFDQTDNRDKWIVSGQRRFFSWLKEELGFYCRPEAICRKYNLKRRQIFRIAAWAVRDFARKVWYFFTHYFSRQCQNVRRYQKALARVEKYLQPKKDGEQ